MEPELMIATVVLLMLAVALFRTKEGTIFMGQRAAKAPSEAVLSASTQIPEGVASSPASTTTQHLQQELPTRLIGRRVFFISMCAGAGFVIGVAIAGLPVIIFLLL